MSREQTELSLVAEYLGAVVAEGDIRTGVQSLLDRDDCPPPEDLHQLLIGRRPTGDTARAYTVGAPNELSNAITALISTPDFRLRLYLRAVNAWPDLRRVFHLHVVKTGGTSVNEVMTNAVELAVCDTIWFADVGFAREGLAEVTQFVKSLALPSTRAVVFSGHTPLSVYWGLLLKRPSDAAFMLLRDPTDILLSQANYMLGESGSRQSNHTVMEAWSHSMPMPAASASLIAGSAEARAAVIALMSSPGFSEEYSNPISRSLYAPLFSLQDGVDLLIEADVVLGSVTRADAVLNRVLDGIRLDPLPRLNKSVKYVESVADLDGHTQWHALPAMLSMDSYLWSRIEHGLWTRDGISSASEILTS